MENTLTTTKPTMKQLNNLNKIRCDLLTGTQLNWVVAQVVMAQGTDGRQFYLDKADNSEDYFVVFKSLFGEFRYEPETNWAQAGPLLNEFKVGCRWDDDGYASGYGENPYPEWEAWVDEWRSTGSTLPKSAMRALAKTKFGETVVLPKEIFKIKFNH